MYGHLLYDQRLRNAGPSDFDCDYDSVNGVYDISIVAAGSSGGFTIHITGASGAVIRELEVKNTGGSGTVVEVNVMGADDDLARVISVKRNPMSSGEMWIGTIDTTDGIGAASSPYGEISVNKIGSLVTSGDITAAINVYGAFGESMSIDSISCGGSLLAVLDVSGGDVGIISVGEDFVSLSTTSVIQGDIDSIIVDGIFLAPISVDTVRRVDVGQFGVDNLFIAQLNAGQISGADAGVFIHGDWISGTIAVELGALTAPIEVDGCFGCLDDVAMLELDEYEDLQTQVVFNKANAGGTWGTAAKICFDKDDIGICDDAITEPYYTITGIDAGSIGLAPFHLHDESCYPANGEQLQISAGLKLNGQCVDECQQINVAASIDRAIVRHYGPVQWSGADPLTVKRRSLSCGGSSTWTDVTSDFSFDIADDSGDREIEVTYTGTGSPNWPIDYEYRIEPVAGVLKCMDVNNDPDVADYDYTFALVADCEELFLAHYDQDHDEALTGLDIVTWSVEPTDLNADSAADGADLSLLMDAVQTFGS